jgi:cytoskeletal protein RodZ
MSVVAVLEMLVGTWEKLTGAKTWLKIQKMIPIGQDMKRERELRGVSLKEIAESTKINIRFLRALEEDQFDVLPGKFFTRGIIREYAKYLGLEEDSVLNKYHDALQALRKDEKEEDTFAESSSVNIKKVIRFAALGAAVIAVVVTLFFIFGGKEATPPIQPPPSGTTPQREAVAPPAESEAVEDTEDTIKELNLAIAFHLDTWIQVYADGELIYEGIKLPGGKLQVIAQEELVIDVGNAGGFTFTLNGHKGKPLGPSGAVEKNIRITLDNFENFIVDTESDDSIT